MTIHGDARYISGASHCNGRKQTTPGTLRFSSLGVSGLLWSLHYFVALLHARNLDSVHNEIIVMSVMAWPDCIF